jgi:capsular exopolysaccharide synthesis family protein
MSQFHNLFRKVVGERDVVPAHPVEDGPESAEQNYRLQNIPVTQVHLEAANRLVFQTDPQSPGAERFRLLRMRLRERSKARKLKTLLITSPLPHDGKSTVTLNLATALAEHGKKSILLVEADLHHSQILQQLGLEASVGFGDCLDQQLDPIAAIRRIEPLGWYLLPGGRPRANATELLQTAAVGDILQSLAPYFDWILIDSPPVLPLTDALSLRQRADACLLVVRADKTPREAVDEAVRLVGKEHILGIVLNGVEGLHRLYSKYGYYRQSLG